MSFIKGMDALQKQLKDAQRAGEALDGPLIDVPVVKGDVESLRAGIAMMEAEIDRRVAPWPNNPLVEQLARQGKAKLALVLAKRHELDLSGCG